MPTCLINTDQDLSEVTFDEYVSLTFAVNLTPYPLVTENHSPLSTEAMVSLDLPDFDRNISDGFCQSQDTLVWRVLTPATAHIYLITSSDS